MKDRRSLALRQIQNLLFDTSYLRSLRFNVRCSRFIHELVNRGFLHWLRYKVFFGISGATSQTANIVTSFILELQVDVGTNFV